MARGQPEQLSVVPVLEQIDRSVRPLLVLPEPAVGREGEAERVAMAEAPDLRGDAALRREGIACGRRAVVVQPHDLAERPAHVLRRLEMLALAIADIEQTVGPEGEA